MPLPEAVEAPPGPSVAPRAPIHPEPAAGGLSAELRAVQVLRQRLRLNALAGRLEAVRPKRTHDVRALDWAMMEAEARSAAGLLSGAWSGWRDTVGTAQAASLPRHGTSAPAGYAFP